MMEKNVVPFADGVKYPFNNFARLFNFYWLLIPIIGWFAVGGYMLKILKELAAGKMTELPLWGNWGDNIKEGVLFFIFYIPLYLLNVILFFIPFLGWILSIVLILVLPLLLVNYAVKRTFASLYDFKWVFKTVFDDFGDYILAYLKTLAFIAIFGLLSIFVVTLIVTFPAMSFGSYFYLADYYRRH